MKDMLTPEEIGRIANLSDEELDKILKGFPPDRSKKGEKESGRHRHRSPRSKHDDTGATSDWILGVTSGVATWAAIGLMGVKLALLIALVLGFLMC